METREEAVRKRTEFLLRWLLSDRVAYVRAGMSEREALDISIDTVSSVILSVFAETWESNEAQARMLEHLANLVRAGKFKALTVAP